MKIITKPFFIAITSLVVLYEILYGSEFSNGFSNLGQSMPSSRSSGTTRIIQLKNYLQSVWTLRNIIHVRGSKILRKLARVWLLSRDSCRVFRGSEEGRLIRWILRVRGVIEAHDHTKSKFSENASWLCEIMYFVSPKNNASFCASLICLFFSWCFQSENWVHLNTQ